MGRATDAINAVIRYKHTIMIIVARY
jgi:hypothetical protein